MNPVPANDVASILSRVVESKTEYDIRLLAQQLGTNYRSLMYWLRGERHIPAYLLPQICILLKNYGPLDLLESQAGRVAFEIPDSRLTSEKELLAVSNLLREVGVALESVAETLADGTVEEGELENDNSQAGCRHSGMCLLEISPRRPLQEEKEETEALSQTEGSNLTSGRQPSGKIDSFSRALIFDLDGTLI